MGVHEFDVVRWLTGQSVASVVAVQTPALDPLARPDADNAQALLSLSGGATAAVSLGRHHPGGDLVTDRGSSVRQGMNDGRCSIPATATSPCWKLLRGRRSRFAELIRGGRRRGAGTADAVAALHDAARAVEALRTEMAVTET